MGQTPRGTWPTSGAPLVSGAGIAPFQSPWTVPWHPCALLVWSPNGSCTTVPAESGPGQGCEHGIPQKANAKMIYDLSGFARIPVRRTVCHFSDFSVQVLPHLACPTQLCQGKGKHGLQLTGGW